MKNLTKIFLAVVALFAYACVTDTTEDLGVKLGGQTEITLSLEESRTHLGEKADGIYPLYWSEGDAIAVNGVASAALTAQQAGSAATLFTFEGELNYPYNIVYPAPITKLDITLGDVRAEGLQTVTFLAEQPYTVGSFAEGAAPMYGYATAETEGPIQMQHLAGVLCLAPKGEGVTLTSLVLKAESGKIAGDFTLNCVDGTLTATESASDTIVVPFAEPLTLTAEATPIYVAIPAGEYGVLVATLHTANDSMTVRFSSSTKPVKAGVVREFAEFVYEANVVSDVFEIYDEASLRKFAKAAAAFYPYTSAKVTAPIDMTGKEWAPIEGFGEFEFDGGNFEIKGLTAPLFGTTAATIKNVKLTDVNIVETERIHSAALVCDLYGTVTNCSATGALTINNTTYNQTAVGSYNDFNVAGLVGHAVGATVTNSTNEIDITIVSLGDPAVSYASLVGGVVAGAKMGCTFRGLTNKGDIVYTSTGRKGNLYISGVVGRAIEVANELSILELSDCVNYGNISTTKDSVSSNDILMAGVTGYLMGNLNLKCDNLTNHGSILAQGECKSLRLNGIMAFKGEANSAKNWINEKTGTLTVDGAKGTTMYLSGTGWQMAGALDNFVNHADITIKNVRDKASSLYIGGVLGVSHGGKKSNLVNNGKLTIGDDITVTGLTRVAGLITEIAYTAGLDFVDIVDSSNNGAISVGGIISEGSGNSGRIYVAGLTTVQNNGIISNCHNTKTATITVKPKTILASETIVAGLISYITSTSIENEVVGLTNCSNSADVELAPVDSFGTYLGGCIAHCWASKTDLNINLTDVTNSGKITLAGGILGTSTAEDGTITTLSSINAVGGIFGYYLAHGNFTNCHNNGEIVVAPTGLASDIQAGGFAGYFAHRIKTKHFEFSNCSNTKKVTFKPAKVNRYGRVGGFIGLATSGANYVTAGSDTDIFTGCFNSGDIEVSGDGTINELWACSFISYMSQGATFTNCYTAENTKVDITINDISANACSGWIGECRQHAANDKYTFNSCSSKVITTYNTAVGGSLRFTGLIGGNNALGNPSGAMTVEATDCFVGGETHIHGTSNTISYGGLLRYPYGASSTYSFNRCTNDCDAFIDATTAAQIEAGGISGYISATLKVDKDTKVSADFNFSGTIGTYLAYGGYWGNINHGSVTDDYQGGHTGNITLTGTVKTNIVLGGIAAQHKAKVNMNGTYNSGKIQLGTKDKALTVGSKAENYIRVGGISCGGATGYDDDKFVHELTNVVNTGDIIVENLVLNTLPAERVWIGGIYGYTPSTITGAKSYCNIQAVGYTNVGMISGSPRTDAILAKDCYVGGTISTKSEEKENSAGDMEMLPKVENITAENYYEYIYGGTTAWTGTDYDGCQYLSVKPKN